MSDLDLREPATILKGGKRGPAVVPGNAEASLLYKAIKRDGELQMPPGKVALTAAEVAIIRDWIDGGARLPGMADSKSGRASSWWSFLKPERPAVPALNDAAWVRNPIDAFILATLEAERTAPGSAGRQTYAGPPRLLRPARSAANAR